MWPACALTTADTTLQHLTSDPRRRRMDPSATLTATAAAIAQLPNLTLTAGSPVQDAFLRCRISSFHDACTWVHQLEYGETISDGGLEALLAERRGTCTTKHGAIAALASEMGLPVHK